MHPRPEDLWPLPGSITIEEGGGRRVLCLRGDLDAAVMARFSSLHGRDPLVVDEIDARAVTFISSTGLAVMLRCVEASAATGRQPVLRSASHSVNRLLQLAGMESAFPRRQPDSGSTAEKDAAKDTLERGTAAPSAGGAGDLPRRGEQLS